MRCCHQHVSLLGSFCQAACQQVAETRGSMLPQVPGYYVAYCGNIAFDATAAELQEVFADCGVTQVRSWPCCS